MNLQDMWSAGVNMLQPEEEFAIASKDLVLDIVPSSCARVDQCS